MRWKNTLLMNASFGTTSSSHLEINPVGSSQIESSNGSLSDLLTSNLEQLILFLRDPRAWNFTHTILVRDEKVDKTPTSSISVFFLGENGPSDEICFTQIFLGYIYGQHHENIYETSSFPVNLLGVMHHFEMHIISTAETVQRGKKEKLMSPPLWKQKEFLKWNSTQYDSMWKTWFK